MLKSLKLRVQPVLYPTLMLRRTCTFAVVFVALVSVPQLVTAQAPAPASTPQARTSTPAKPVEKKKAKSTRKTKQQPKAVVQTPPPPPPPQTPEQMPSVAPEVIYRAGMLTINAQNSTMNDVLAAVRRVTGATIEKPPVGGADRVYAHLGPAAPKDVLDSLFRGSRYDYIILGPLNRPGGVERIILTARANTIPSTPGAVNNPGQTPPAPNVQQQQAQQEQEEPETDTEDMSVPERDQAEPEQPQPQQGQPQGMPTQPPQEQPQTPPTPDQQQNPQNQNQGQGQPQVKSPEELLRELQQMQKQAPDQNQQQQDRPPQ